MRTLSICAYVPFRSKAVSKRRVNPSLSHFLSPDSHSHPYTFNVQLNSLPASLSALPFSQERKRLCRLEIET